MKIFGYFKSYPALVMTKDGKLESEVTEYGE